MGALEWWRTTRRGSWVGVLRRMEREKGSARVKVPMLGKVKPFSPERRAAFPSGVSMSLGFSTGLPGLAGSISFSTLLFLMELRGKRAISPLISRWAGLEWSQWVKSGESWGAIAEAIEPLWVWRSCSFL